MLMMYPAKAELHAVHSFVGTPSSSIESEASPSRKRNSPISPHRSHLPLLRAEALQVGPDGFLFNSKLTVSYGTPARLLSLERTVSRLSRQHLDRA